MLAGGAADEPLEPSDAAAAVARRRRHVFAVLVHGCRAGRRDAPLRRGRGGGDQYRVEGEQQQPWEGARLITRGYAWAPSVPDKRLAIGQRPRRASTYGTVRSRILTSFHSDQFGDVQVVDRDHLAQRDPRGAEDLPVPGHPGLQVQPAAVPALDLPVLVLDQRPRADEAHLAAQHVEELGQLVERAAPQAAGRRA